MKKVIQKIHKNVWTNFEIRWRALILESGNDLEQIWNWIKIVLVER